MRGRWLLSCLALIAGALNKESDVPLVLCPGVSSWGHLRKRSFALHWDALTTIAVPLLVTRRLWFLQRVLASVRSSAGDRASLL